ncbi:MAG: phage tail protein [Burkholderia gladioli]
MTFDLITYFEGSETRIAAQFAEHALIEGKPRLQWTGDKLDEVTWTLVFHLGFCDPEKELQKLKKLIAEHQAAPLHYSNGEYKGTFVATDCSATSRQVMRDGTLIWLEASLTLKEFVEPPAPVEQKAAQRPVAAEKRSANGRRKPPRTVKAAAKSRSKSAPVTRNEWGKDGETTSSFSCHVGSCQNEACLDQRDTSDLVRDAVSGLSETTLRQAVTLLDAAILRVGRTALSGQCCCNRRHA